MKVKFARWQFLLVGCVILILAGLLSYKLGADRALNAAVRSYSFGKPGYIDVFSNISPINIYGDPYCNGTKTEKGAPYLCPLKYPDLSTTIWVDQEVIHKGQVYHFVTWDGCSFAHEDKTICQVSTQPDENKVIRVTYARGKKP